MSTVKEILELNKSIFKKKTSEINNLKNQKRKVEEEAAEKINNLKRKLEEQEQVINKFRQAEAERIQGIRRREAVPCKPTCLTCPTMVRTPSVTSSKTGETVELKHNLNCRSEYSVYVINCRACPYKYVGAAKVSIHERSQGHRREIKKNIGSLGRHFHSGDPRCSEAGYTLQLLDQSPDYQMRSLRQLEGWYALQLPEVFDSGSNQRVEGKNIRKKK